MTAEEKFINNIKAYLIKEDAEFLKLTKEEQNELIIAAVQKYIDMAKLETS